MINVIDLSWLSIPVFVLLIIGILGDAFTTIEALKLPGASEANPLMRAIMKVANPTITMWGTHLAFIGFLVWAQTWTSVMTEFENTVILHPSLAMVFTGAVFIGASVNNYLLIRKLS